MAFEENFVFNFSSKTKKFKKAKCSLNWWSIKSDDELIQYVMDAETHYEAKNRCSYIKVFQNDNFSAPLLRNLELHNLLKYSDSLDVLRFVQTCVLDVGHVFWKDFILYISNFIYQQDDMEEISLFRRAFKAKSTSEIGELFSTCIYHNPSKDAEIYVSCLILFPKLTPKLMNKAFPAILKRPNLPECIEIFMKLTSSHFEHINLKRDDATSVLKKYVFLNYDRLMETGNRSNKKEMNKTAKLFLRAVRQPSNSIFLKIGTGKDSPLETFLKIPKAFELKQNSEMFLTFFFCYVRLGLFEITEDTIMTWNPYFDDRWLNNNRADLFENDTLYRMYHWEEEFRNLYPRYLKEGGNKFFVHPFDRNLRMLNRMHELVKFSEKNVLLKRFGYQLFIQYFSIALGYCDNHDRMDKLFHHNKDKVESEHGKMCVYMNALLSHAKRGNVETAAKIWRIILERCVEWNLLKNHTTKRSKLDIPLFVGKQYAADISTRIMRNLLFVKAKKNGVEGWIKYGLLILFICDLTPDTFVNYNMIENLILRTDETMALQIFSNNWAEYITTLSTMNKIYIQAVNSCPSLLEKYDFLKLIEKKRGKLDPPKENVYLILQQKLKDGDEIFKCIQN